MSNQQETDAANVLSQMSQLVHMAPDATGGNSTALGIFSTIDRKDKESLFNRIHDVAECTSYETNEHAYAQNTETALARLREPKKHKCTVCGKLFTKLYNLRAHSRVHTKERPHQCLVCGKAFSLYGDLVRHSRIHSGEKPYQCGRCGRRFTDYGTYKRHTRLHTNDFPYICQVCHKAFNRLDSYNNHLLTHSQEKPFVCEVCQKEFNYNSSYKRHLRSHSTEWNYTCNVCNKKFTRSDSLKCHSRVHELSCDADKIDALESGEDIIVTNLPLENELVISGMDTVPTVCDDQMINLPATYANTSQMCLPTAEASGDGLLNLRNAMQNEIEGRNAEISFPSTRAVRSVEDVAKNAKSETSSCRVPFRTGKEITPSCGNSQNLIGTAIRTSQNVKPLAMSESQRHFTSVSVQTEPMFNESPEAMREFLCSIDSLMNPASALATPESNVSASSGLHSPNPKTIPRAQDMSAVNNFIKSITTPILEMIQRKEPLVSKKDQEINLESDEVPDMQEFLNQSVGSPSISEASSQDDKDMHYSCSDNGDGLNARPYKEGSACSSSLSSSSIATTNAFLCDSPRNHNDKSDVLRGERERSQSSCIAHASGVSSFLRTDLSRILSSESSTGLAGCLLPNSTSGCNKGNGQSYELPEKRLPNENSGLVTSQSTYNLLDAASVAQNNNNRARRLPVVPCLGANCLTSTYNRESEYRSQKLTGTSAMIDTSNSSPELASDINMPHQIMEEDPEIGGIDC